MEASFSSRRARSGARYFTSTSRAMAPSLAGQHGEGQCTRPARPRHEILSDDGGKRRKTPDAESRVPMSFADVEFALSQYGISDGRSSDRAEWPEIGGLRRIGAEFHLRGWSVGTSSNYSVVLGRDPLRLLVTASGKDKGRLTADDFVVVDAAGKPVGENHAKPS